jgi:hypothetical protein
LPLGGLLHHQRTLIVYALLLLLLLELLQLLLWTAWCNR